MTTKHELKCWPEFFDAIEEGSKPFDLRRNDRKFKVGDKILFRRFNDKTAQYTGAQLERRITYVMEGIGPGCITPVMGLARGYCILGLAI